MTALHRAVPLAERDDVSVGIGEQLHLHVPRALEVPLAVERAVAERSCGLALGCSECIIELGLRPDDAHPAASTTRSRLDEEGEADLACRSVDEHRNTRLARDPLRLELVSAQP